MSLTLSIVNHIRRAKQADRQTRVSHFQFRIVKERPILVDLRDGQVRLLPLEGKNGHSELALM